MTSLPDTWPCDRCSRVVAMEDTCIVPESLEIICESCDEERQEKEADACDHQWKFVDAPFDDSDDDEPDYDAP